MLERMNLFLLTFSLLFLLFYSSAPSVSAQSFSFGAAGDFNKTANFQATVNAAGASGIDFFVTLGDNSYSSGSEKSWCDTFKSKVPQIALIAGNHDTGESSGGDINVYRQHCQYNASPIQGDFGKQYYFDYPSSAPLARFIMITPGNEGSVNIPYTKGSAGYNFTASAIDDARAKNIPWIIVGMHKNYISALEKSNEVGADLMPLLFSKQVDLILQGHEHGYERTKQLKCAKVESYDATCVVDSDSSMVKGAGSIIHVIGTGGASLRELNKDDPEYPYFATTDVTTYGLGKFTVSKTELKFAFVRSAGGNFTDSFTIAGSDNPGTTNPSFFPLAPCPTCTNPSNPAPDESKKEPVKQIIAPTVITSPPPADPCTNGTGIADSKKKKQSKHKEKNGAISGFMKIFIQLLMLLLELIQGQGKAVPCSQSGTQPLPPPPPISPPTIQPSTSLLKPAATFTTHKNLQFSTVSPRLVLDLYTPNNDTNAPVIVWLYGGGWETGSKDQNCFPKDLQLMKQGFAVVCMNYRLTDEAPFPAQIEDVKSAIRWLRANATKYKLYDKKIGIWGASAGGHLASLAGTTGDTKLFDKGEHLSLPSTADAVVTMAGPTDLIAWGQLPLHSSSPEFTRIMTKLLGGPLSENQEKAKTANPINYITPNDAPFMIFHGEIDIVVPASQGQLLHNALQAASIKSTLTVFPGQDHGAPDFLSPKTINAIVSFYDNVLR